MLLLSASVAAMKYVLCFQVPPGHHGQRGRLHLGQERQVRVQGAVRVIQADYQPHR